MTNYNYPATLLCDFYKISHFAQYPEKTQQIFSTWTPRKSRIKGVDKVVAFGFQYFVKEFLINYFNENFFKRNLIDVIYEYDRVLKYTLGVEEPEHQHIIDLHTLGYLPLRVRAVKEGTLIPMRVPMLTVENSSNDERFFWIGQYLESVMSSELWSPTTSATLAHLYYQIGAKYADETVGNREHLPFQFHDFSFRGMEGLVGGANSGAGHLLSFVGTDTVPSILFHEKYYKANIETELVGTSIPATEHSVMCANSNPDNRDEYDNFKRLITETYPKGFVSIVSDTYDFWNIIGDVIPRLKQDILNRDGRVVIRPDSGDPVKILVGSEITDLTNEAESFEDAKDIMYENIMDELREETPHGEYGDDRPSGQFKFKDKYYTLTIDVEWNRYDKQYYYIDGHKERSCVEFQPKLSDLGLVEALWNIFGGTVNELGYKVLDPHIGAIYGDSITPERAKSIFEGLKQKGFASSNVVLGVGSYTYQYNTRDTFGFAMKATYVVIDGKEKLIFKDPKTDDGTKKSQRGLVAVIKAPTIDGEELQVVDGLTREEYYKAGFDFVDLLEDIFVDGQLVREQSLSEIRELLASQV